MGVNEPEKYKRYVFGPYCALIVIFLTIWEKRGFKTWRIKMSVREKKCF